MTNGLDIAFLSCNYRKSFRANIGLKMQVVQAMISFRTALFRTRTNILLKQHHGQIYLATVMEPRQRIKLHNTIFQ